MLIETGDSARREVRTALEAVLASPLFAGKRRGELLRYLAERTLAGKGDSITEYGIALDVFRRPESFDPRTESTIRAEMSRLRKALVEYYKTVGSGEQWRFEFPARGYVPEVVRKEIAVPAPKSRSRSIWITAAVTILLAGGVAFGTYRSFRAPLRSVVVLPFGNLTGDPNNDHLSDGITEGLTDSLAHIASLRVVARTSAFQFRGKALDIREIGSKVNADAVVEGSLQKAGDRYQVTVQVNRSKDGYHMLSRVFEGAQRDLARIQNEIAGPVSAALRPGEPVTAGRAPDSEAWDLVLKARTLRRLTPLDTFDQSVALLHQAIGRDPNYADAWAELANTYAGAATTLPVDPAGAAREAKSAAARALELDPGSAEAYAASGLVDAMVFLEWKLGEDDLHNALRLAPQNAMAHQRLANVELLEGHFDVAMREAKLSESLDPLAGNAGVAVGMVYFMQRRYPEALAEFTRVAALHPDIPVMRLLVGGVYDAMGGYARALAEYDSVAASYPKESEIRTVLALVHARRIAEARRRLEKLESAGQKDAFSFAVIYGELGEKDRAFAYLEQAWQEHNCWMLKVYPFLDPLRADSRYAAFLKRAHLDR